jgi:hypothetical protein
MHLHLDLVGGIAGDMFVAAMLDYAPELAPKLNEQIVLAGFPNLVKLHSEVFNDGILSGQRFNVTAAENAHGHEHRHHREIKRLIQDSALAEPVKMISLAIFQLLAEAEASVHGTPVADIAFHEVGAWDSIADIICAAFMIHTTGVQSASVSSIPAGRGQVMTAHGRLPVPAPATALLLEGFTCIDDGLDGERVTPTGAAILRYLVKPEAAASTTRGQLKGSGYGFGRKQFAGISNTLRVMAYDATSHAVPAVWLEDQILQLEFEIDDQTPEDLAIGLAAIRDVDGVIDVITGTALAKKNRQTHWVRILAQPAIESPLLLVCFEQTTTLGIRKQLIQRAVLSRQMVQLVSDELTYQVKLATRPSGTTVKADIDQLTPREERLTGQLGTSHQARQQLRQQIERLAIQRYNQGAAKNADLQPNNEGES